MKTKETSTREQALAWWKQLCLSCELDDTHYVLDNLIRKHDLGFERKYTSLTGREIEIIWRKENQKQLPSINESLTKLGIDYSKQAKANNSKVFK